MTADRLVVNEVTTELSQKFRTASGSQELLAFVCKDAPHKTHCGECLQLWPIRRGHGREWLEQRKM